ncbi:MAG TPA: HU family DNA-binding protein [Ramlibacter sp.]|nr:HU family DNA-binding protein [Ramlibacter sp.]
MATAKKPAKTAKTAPVAATKKTAAKAPSAAVKPTVKALVKAPVKAPAKADAAMKPIKESFNKTGLITHLAGVAGQEPKAVKAILGALEATMLASVNKKGLGSFTLPGLLKVTALQVAAKKKRVGIDPFTKQERTFAAKPATVKLKVRSLKKLKDAAL